MTLPHMYSRFHHMRILVIFYVIGKNLLKNYHKYFELTTNASQITNKQTILALGRPVCVTARYAHPQNRTGLRFAQNSWVEGVLLKGRRVSVVADETWWSPNETSFRYPRGLYGTNNKLSLVVITFAPSIWRPSSPEAISICPSESQTVSQLPTARVRQRWRTQAQRFDSIARAERTTRRKAYVLPFPVSCRPPVLWPQKYIARLRHYQLMRWGSVKAAKRRLMLIRKHRKARTNSHGLYIGSFYKPRSDLILSKLVLVSWRNRISRVSSRI